MFWHCLCLTPTRPHLDLVDVVDGVVKLDGLRCLLLLWLGGVVLGGEGIGRLGAGGLVVGVVRAGLTARCAAHVRCQRLGGRL